MSVPELRNYRVALVGYGVYAICVTRRIPVKPRAT
jgi:hypothetical protein